MKKLVTMAAVLIILDICLPAYSNAVTDANILVYKVSISGKALTYDDNEVGSASMRGYLVVEVDVASTDCNFIVYGKDDDGNKIQTYWDLTINRSLQDSSIGVHFEEFTWGIFEGNLIGKNAKEMDIGAAEEAIVAKSLTGHILMWVGPLMAEAMTGSGKISMKLDNRLTQEYNGEGKDRVAAAIAIQELLDEKGYD
jgi:hypothetical protein